MAGGTLEFFLRAGLKKNPVIVDIFKYFLLLVGHIQNRFRINPWPRKTLYHPDSVNWKLGKIQLV